MTSGTTGQMVFQSANSSQVFSSVSGNCSVGSSIDVDQGVYMVNTMWTMSQVSNVSLNFESGAELVAGKNLDSPVLFLNNANNCYVSGVTIDGNAANQAIGTYPLFSNGILIVGSDDEVVDATVFNCRVMGVMISTYGSVQGSVGDGVIGCKLYDCGWNGFGVENPHNIDCYATNNVVYGCSDVGISTYGTDTQIMGNYVHDMNGTTGGGGNAEWGIAVEGGSNATITQNTVQNCSIGIEDSGLNNCIISKNLVISASQARP